MKKIVFLLLVISLGINSIWFLSDGIFSLKLELTERIQSDLPDKYKTIDEFHNSLIARALYMLDNDEITPNLAPGRFRSTKETIVYNITNNNSNFKSVPYIYNMGWLAYSVLIDGIANNDKKLINAVERFFDNYINTVEIRYDDCGPYGLVAIELYKITKFTKYKNYADKLYTHLTSWKNEYGVVYHNLKHVALVDAIGLSVPFMFHYYKTFDDPNALELAKRTIEMFSKYGVDSMTGIPAHGYSLSKPHFKMGSSHWGRGIAWWCIGLLSFKGHELSKDIENKKLLLTENLNDIYLRNDSFSQFLRHKTKNVDTSALLPILFFLKSNNIINLSENKILSLSEYCRDGFVYFSSGDTEDINLYSQFMGAFPLSQAFMIMLTSKADKEYWFN